MESNGRGLTVETLEIENSCVILSLTGAFDHYGETPDCDKNKKAPERFSHEDTVRHTSSQPNLFINENYFASPEILQKSSRISVLESAIQEYTTQAKNCSSSQERSKIIKKLIQLRYELMDLKDSSSEMKNNLNCLMGHTFEVRPWGRAKVYCEKCCSVIIGLFQSSYTCTQCSYCCHTKCINNLSRICPSQTIKENPMPRLKICPETGLHAQQYSCLECKAPIGFQPDTEEARQCDYTGFFYCNKCHWNDSVPIPARVIANWDFEPKKVCRASKAILRLMAKKAVYNISEINPMLFTYINELSEIGKRREEVLIMKTFFLECPFAMKERYLLKLKHRQHFVENSDVYSFQDLMDTQQDVLLPELTKIHALFSQHIKSDCEFCKSKGRRCKICNSDEVLFPFDCTAHVCCACSSIMHMRCYQMENKRCPEGCS